MKTSCLNVGTISASLLHELEDLYCSIWRDPPWNEEWDPAQVEAKIHDEMSQPNAKGLLAFSDTGVMEGFTWGYEVTPHKLVEIAGTSLINFVFRGSAIRLFYISELGVAKTLRHQGAGRALSLELISAIRKDCGINHFILRTDEHAAPARSLYKHLGFSEILVRDANHPERTYWTLDCTLHVAAAATPLAVRGAVH
jgi:ribosomal protein S18 acetylase RimI-like enzyme